MDHFFFASGFVLLFLGADVLLRGAKAIARGLGASEIAIGLTVVSIGTSLPEMIVNVFASFGGHPALAIGNVLGSNIANILLILGTAALVRSLPIRDATVFSEIPFSLAATMLVGFLANAHLFDDERVLSLSRLDGAILLGFFLLFLTYIYRVWGEPRDARLGREQGGSLSASVVRVVAGSVALAVGAHWVVEGAIDLGRLLGLSSSFVGLTVVAVGTSLPELVTCLLAAYRGNTDLVIGNAIGSNIFNLLWVLGLSAAIRPLPFALVSNTDIVMVIGASTALLLAIAVGRRYAVERSEGLVFIVVYVLYLGFLLQRG